MSDFKERPILFSAPMVRALLDGTKTQTRRIVKTDSRPQSEDTFMKGFPEDAQNVRMCFAYAKCDAPPGSRSVSYRVPCPYGYIGDQLWVREEHYRFGHWEPFSGIRTKFGRQKWAFIPAASEVLFDAPASFRKGRHHHDPASPAWHKRLARFMPRRLSRLTLGISMVKVERLQDITEADAVAEGCITEEVISGYDGKLIRVPKLIPDPSGIGEVGWDSCREWYADLWESINGPGSWEANPWVWVVEFEVIHKGAE